MMRGVPASCDPATVFMSVAVTTKSEGAVSPGLSAGPITSVGVPLHSTAALRNSGMAETCRGLRRVVKRRLCADAYGIKSTLRGLAPYAYLGTADQHVSPGR